MPRKSGLSGGLAAALGGVGATPQGAIGGGGRGGNAGSSLLSSIVLGSADLDSETALLLRKLNKKDPTTKIKALADLCEAIRSRGADWAGPLLPHWTLAFVRLADDTSWQVREQACVALDLLAQQEDDGGVQSAHTRAWRARTIQYTPEAHDT